MPRLRIAMVTASITARGAGVATSIEGLSQGLEKAGHEVQVFALAEGEEGKGETEWSGAASRQFPILGPNALGFAPQMLPALIEWKPTIVHLHGLWMHTSRTVAEWAKRTGRPFVISPHGMLAPSALAFSPAKKRLARLLYQDRCFAEASAFHATCEAEALDIKRFGLIQRTEIIPHGIRPRVRPDVSRDGKTVLSLGRLHPVKGLDVLIAAWSILEGQFPEWRLKIVGPDEHGYREQLERLIAGHGLVRCTIGPALYGEEKYRALAEASVFVLPSQSENFGLTVLESLLMGTPVVASHGTPWSVLREQSCGDWVAGNAESLSRAIARLIEVGSQTRAAMGARGRELVETAFSWDAIADKAATSYAQVLESKSTAA